MIEIAFDKNKNNIFQQKEYRVLRIPPLNDKPFEAYSNFAEEIFNLYQNEPYLIVFEDNSLFDTNKLALALFIQSCFFAESILGCVVFKTDDTKLAFEKHKPYIAVGIGIKYALRLSSENEATIYKELKTLNYLNFSITENFTNKTLLFRLDGRQPLKKIETQTLKDAIIFVSLLKILSLAGIDENIELLVHITQNQEQPNPQELISKILEKTKPYINI